MRTQRAFTLIELTISMSASSVLMVLAIGLVQQSMFASSIANQRADHHRTLVRLADQFRLDIHLADEIDFTSPNRLHIQLPSGGAVVYAIDANRCQREESLADDGRHVETYELLTGCLVAFEQVDSPNRMVLTVKRGIQLTGNQPLVDAHVEAIVGRMIAFQEPGEVGE